MTDSSREQLQRDLVVAMKAMASIFEGMPPDKCSTFVAEAIRDQRDQLTEVELSVLEEYGGLLIQGAMPADEYARMAELIVKPSAMRVLIDDAIDAGPKMVDDAGQPLPNQSPAVEAGVVIRGTSLSIHGSLSRAPNGLLRLMYRSDASGPGRPPQLIEQFFHYDDVAVFALVHEVTAEVQRIVRA